MKSTQPSGKYGIKTLTWDELNVYLRQCPDNIYIDSIQTDVVSSSTTHQGPWHYKNAIKTYIYIYIYYHTIGSIKTKINNISIGDVEKSVSKRIALYDLKRWGFPTKLIFKWYSWLRFESFAAEKFENVDTVLSNKTYFINLLKQVHDYYRRTTYAQQAEELEPYKGPQSYDLFINPYLRRDNAAILHYYGRGLIPWYKQGELKKHLLAMVGEDNYKIIELELFGYDPFTHKVSKVQFNQRLHLTNQTLSKNLGREDIALKLIPYSGPQCHEDRGNEQKMKYNPDFRFKHPILQTDFKTKDCMKEKKAASYQQTIPNSSKEKIPRTT